MQKNHVIEIALSLFLIFLSFFMTERKNLQEGNELIKLPSKIMNIEGKEHMLDKEEQDFVSETGTIIEKKKYGTYTITLISGNSPKLLHSPVVCYEANGYTVKNEEIMRITNDLKAVKLTVNSNGKAEYVYYWFFNKNKKTTDFSDVFISSARGDNNWHLVSIASSDDNENSKEFIIKLDNSL